MEVTMIKNKILVRNLGITPYNDIFKAMIDFTTQRTDKTNDEIWLTEHPSVFTQGKTGKTENILTYTDSIPIVQTDRGGQITYHGPGQQIMYILIDIKRQKIRVSKIVNSLENCIIACLSTFDLVAEKRMNAPGIYISNKKICSLGIQITRGCTLHGLAFNIDMNLKPFDLINPCGYSGLKMTMLSQFTEKFDRQQIRYEMASTFAHLLGYEQIDYVKMEQLCQK